MLCTLQEAISRLDYLCNRLLDVRLNHEEMQPGHSDKDLAAKDLRMHLLHASIQLNTVEPPC
jgi:hypothetical protein